MSELKVGIAYELEVRGRTAEIEQRTFENVLAQIVTADELGYGSIWFVEHHFTRGFSHSSAPDLLLAAIARETRQIRLGLGVVLLPFNHPVRTAERVATLDIVSRGRVEFGTGRGASPLEYQTFNQPFEQSRNLWEENLDIILAIWEADGQTVSIEHPLWAIPDVSILPRPVQQPHPPVWVASTSLDGFVAAGQRGYNLLAMPMVKGLDDLAEDVAIYKKTLEEHDFDPSTRRIGMLIPWHVGATRDEALATATDSVLWYIRRQLNLVVPPDTYDARHATYQVFGQRAAGLPPDEAMQVLRDNCMIVVDDVAGSQKALQKVAEAGATDILCQFQVGGIDHESVLRSMKCFATEVVQL
jgi:alkanesulfonate monooxygenase SsuD/methylene tetrahydromethanopterin reductase-like flavin-dependent oxidoreductase (luciferase family)